MTGKNTAARAELTCRECGATAAGEPINIHSKLPRGWERYSPGSAEVVCSDCVGAIIARAQDALATWVKQNPDETHLPPGLLDRPGELDLD